MDPHVTYWLDGAGEDLDASRAMLEKKMYLYCGFFCHLAAEKALKAMVSAQSQTAPPIHNLLRLAELADMIDIMSESQLALLEQLNPLSIEARYPSDKKRIAASLTADICVKLIADTENLVLWLRTKLEN
ncbi:MAG: HEPN domain-containing protein [Coriobacteriia bacterium]|nr:HEPN domain-containing protein [Coriobacteriia bacterium]